MLAEATTVALAVSAVAYLYHASAAAAHVVAIGRPGAGAGGSHCAFGIEVVRLPQFPIPPL